MEKHGIQITSKHVRVQLQTHCAKERNALTDLLNVGNDLHSVVY